MIIRVIFLNGTWFDFEKPDNVEFANLIRSLRADHFLACGSFYFPEHVILGILCAPADVLATDAMALKGTAQNAPTTGTKQ